MIVRRADMKVEQKEKMRGGDGVVTMRHLVDGSTMKNARLGRYSSRIALSAGPFGPWLVKTRISRPRSASWRVRASWR